MSHPSLPSIEERVSTGDSIVSEQVKIGQFVRGSAERDAIHIAIAPVVAGEDLSIGQHVGFLADGTVGKDSPNLIGIVDPFLGYEYSSIPMRVRKGDRFYLFLYPNSVINLRHHWRHPAFSDETGGKATDMEAAVEWLKDYAVRNCSYDAEYGRDVAYQKFIGNVVGGSIFYHGSDLHSASEVEQPEELYHNLSIVLGRDVSEGDFEFSCSC